MVTLTWVSALGMLAGALVKDPAGATRLAFFLLVLVLSLIPAAAFGIRESSIANGATWADHVDSVHPYSWLEVIVELDPTQAEFFSVESMAIPTLAGLGFAGLLILWSTRAIRPHARMKTARRSHGRWTRSWRLTALLERHPVVWLGLKRKSRMRLGIVTAAVALPILGFEYLFVQDLGRIGATRASGTPSAVIVYQSVSFYLSYSVPYLILGAVFCIAAGAGAIHRERQADTLTALLATPLTSHRIVRGLYVSSLLTGLPFWMFPVLHGIAGVFLGHLGPLSVIVFALSSAVFLGHATVIAMFRGVRKKTMMQATASANLLFFGGWTLAVIPFSIMAVIVGLISGAIGSGLPLQLGMAFHPAWLAVAPLVAGFVWPDPPAYPLIYLIPAWVFFKANGRMLRDKVTEPFMIAREGSERSRRRHKRVGLDVMKRAIGSRSRRRPPPEEDRE